jgi:hypothetical protein
VRVKPLFASFPVRLTQMIRGAVGGGSVFVVGDGAVTVVVVCAVVDVVGVATVVVDVGRAVVTNETVVVVRRVRGAGAGVERRDPERLDAALRRVSVPTPHPPSSRNARRTEKC